RASTELTFELRTTRSSVFTRSGERGVIAGGNYDVDCVVSDPGDRVLYQERKKQYDSFSHTTSTKGVYRVCFSNEFSTFSHKTIYLDFRFGEERPLLPDMNRGTGHDCIQWGLNLGLCITYDVCVCVYSQMESACLSIHEILKVVVDSQTWYRLREAQDRIRAEDLNQRISYWSVGETIILFVVSIGQVLMLRSFFIDKKSSVATNT
uniref:GOLD domain-containing protein n=1 Tax=Denticeps clupeoides TaxID=299321 RepID=A0AAY4BMB5_9TELE